MLCAVCMEQRQVRLVDVVVVLCVCLRRHDHVMGKTRQQNTHGWHWLSKIRSGHQIGCHTYTGCSHDTYTGCTCGTAVSVGIYPACPSVRECGAFLVWHTAVWFSSAYLAYSVCMKWEVLRTRTRTTAYGPPCDRYCCNWCAGSIWDRL